MMDTTSLHDYRFSARMRRAVVFVISIAAMSFLGDAAWAQTTPSIAGIWRIEKPIVAVRTVDGKEPPLRADAAKIYQAHIASHQRGDDSFDSATWCASVGMPRIMLINYPFEIVVRPQYVTFLYEWNWWARVTYLDGALNTGKSAAVSPQPAKRKESFDPTGKAPPLTGVDPIGPMGLSLSKWDGDTLVIETAVQRDSTLIDNAGLPHSDALKMTERLKLRGPDLLEDRIRFEDPKTFTQPWETVLTYRRQQGEIKEDVCLDRIKAGQPAVKD
jgi:hypothetical protein